ncbi:ras-related protein Rab-43 [Parasteatoda tepidariorum]|uniref:ras-related protein Rab-43 n=1 Tax=Parasteatoda tepidariorum TaxID=114398 RepID=UPI00077F9C1D|nr:ras-related protein Rab-43 isoform X1 [Parasteatoda tepidariorum]
MAKNVNKDRPSDFYFKLILLGDYNVGKTSIFRRFKDNEFKESGNLSVGIDNYSKVIEVDGQNVTLVLWDTVGTERFRTLTRNYFRNADACLIVFSSNEPETLTSLTQWVRDADDFSENALKALIRNKNDLKCLIAQEKVNAFAHHHDCDIVFNISAKTGEGIQEMFKTIAQKLILKSSRVQKNQSLFERDVHQLDAHEVDVKATCC